MVFELIKPCKERKKGMCNSGSLIDEGCLNTVGAFREDKRGVFVQGSQSLAQNCRTALYTGAKPQSNIHSITSSQKCI